jgi:flagellum-specific ATP synthase
MVELAKYHRLLEQIDPIRVHGKVSEIIGLVVVGHGPVASIGEMCGIFPGNSDTP